MKKSAVRLAKKWWSLVAIAVAVAVVIAMGGFNKRSDLFTAVAPGAEMDCRNLIFTFTSATAQRVVSDYAPPHWEISAIGTVRNPTDDSVEPLLDAYGQFAFKNPNDGQIIVPPWGSATIGGDEKRRYVVPGLAATGFRLTTSPADGFSPGSEILLAVGPAENTDNVVLGLGSGKTIWNIDSRASSYLVTLPLTTLPDRKQ